MKSKIIFTAMVVFTLALSACASAAPTAMPATLAPVIPITGQSTDTPVATAMPVATATMAPVATPTSPAAVNAGQNAALGSFLVNSSGWTLYIFTNDTPATSSATAVSACTDSCTSVWQPLLTNGAATAGTGVTASMLGTLTRPDGSVQVTYNGWPLYTYSQDMAAGDTNGQGYKSLWYAITPAGMQASAAMPASSTSMAPTSTY
jgi:predicted lipoprotein with Yx(FWY)xxD motif